MPSLSADRTRLLVIGAGPFGLAIAAFAGRSGVDALVVGEPMAFWKSHMPAGMRLRSGVDWHLDAGGEWTIARFLSDRGLAEGDVTPIPLAIYLEYAEWFRQQAAVRVLRGTVQQLLHGDGHCRFLATLADGRRIAADHVAVAVGFQYFPHIADSLASRLPADRYEHTCTATALETLAGKRCLIVGGRQSAFEWAALLAEAGAARVDLTYRHDTPHFAQSQWAWADALVERFVSEPGWYRQLRQDERDRLARRFWAEGRLKLEPWLTPGLDPRRVTMRPGTEIRSASVQADDAVRVTLSNGESLAVDRIILATGYKPSLSRVPFLTDQTLMQAIETANGSPILDDRMQSTQPGLFFTSLLATESYGPFVAFTVSARAAAQLIVRGIDG
jgi:cation diffusion facilitator CzcD-associated flavoprotein CzcO